MYFLLYLMQIYLLWDIFVDEMTKKRTICIEKTRQKVLECKDISEFQRRVYLALLEVPYGTTVSYGELARRIGCRSAQAVGQALKRNPFAPDVPCHRVIASDGSIGGFHGEREGEMIARKQCLLDREKETCKTQKQK